MCTEQESEVNRWVDDQTGLARDMTRRASSRAARTQHSSESYGERHRAPWRAGRTRSRETCDRAAGSVAALRGIGGGPDGELERGGNRAPFACRGHDAQWAAAH